MADYRDENPKIGALIGQLVEDGKAYAQAEIDYLKAVAGERAREAKNGAILIVAGLILLHGALIALFVGAVLSLATVTGPLLATAIVVIVAALVGGVLAKLGISHFSRAKAGPDLPAIGTESDA